MMMGEGKYNINMCIYILYLSKHNQYFSSYYYYYCYSKINPNL